MAKNTDTKNEEIVVKNTDKVSEEVEIENVEIVSEVKQAEEQKIKLFATRRLKSDILDVVLGNFELTKDELEQDKQIQNFIKIGFVREL